MKQAKWVAVQAESDHDHCAFCWAEFAAHRSEHVEYDAGWVTADDNYTWVCPPCFEDFRILFAWVIADDATGS